MNKTNTTTVTAAATGHDTIPSPASVAATAGVHATAQHGGADRAPVTALRHTPGPWSVEQNGGTTCSVVVTKGGIRSRIAECHYFLLADEHGGNYQSNAQLIAAAPELLDAVKEAIAWADNVPAPYREWPFIAAARAALAKAEGRAA